MGGTCSAAATEEDVKNKKIEKEQEVAVKKNDQIIKLLLLGAGESGKSTIFKQMKILFGKHYEEEELKNLAPIVHNNVMQNFLVVLNYAKKQDIQFDNNGELESFINDYNHDTPVTEEVAKRISILWNDSVCQTVWAQRSAFQVLDCLNYYCLPENLKRMSQVNYLPNKMDILQARVRTSGIVEEKYIIDGVQFSMFDVGGQRNERKKWIHCFDGVTAVIFVAAISEYDQMLFEDNKTKRMDEATKLFDEICNSPWFTKTSIILFLNKKDLFEDKLFKIPYKVAGLRNEDFQGPIANDPGVSKEEAIEAATKHSLKKFLAVRRDESKEIYHHVTCATDTQNVQVVFGAVSYLSYLYLFIVY